RRLDPLHLALDDHDLVAALRVEDDARIGGEQPRLARLGVAAEDEAVAAPEAPDGRRVRPGGRDPVVVRRREALLRPRPRERAVLRLGHAVLRHPARSAGARRRHSPTTTRTADGAAA